MSQKQSGRGRIAPHFGAGNFDLQNRLFVGIFKNNRDHFGICKWGAMRPLHLFLPLFYESKI
jgi:hypothetical protein